MAIPMSTATFTARQARAVSAVVHDRHVHAHRSLSEIDTLIDGSSLSATGKDRAKQLFARLGEAEAAIHGTPLDRVHLHEVGALDSIIDIVGTVHALEMLKVDRIVASPLNVGSGSVRSAHGTYPVPAPATAWLLRGCANLFRVAAGGARDADRCAAGDELCRWLRSHPADAAEAGGLRRRNA